MIRTPLLALTLLAIGLTSSSIIGQGSKPPVPPADKPAERLKIEFWKKRHEKFLEQTKKGGIEVVFLGDSITQGWEGKNGAAAWKTHFEAFKPGNYGISGDQTSHVLWRLTQGKELDGLNPKLAVIMIGTNNTAAHTADQIADGIKAIVEQLRKDKPQMKILLLGVFPRATAPKEAKVATKEQLNKKIPEINKLISKLDDGKMVFFKDIGEKFLTSDGGLSREVMPDLLHLSAKGYEIWAEAIKEDIAKLVK
ncbi:MAG: GDSL-type esterase/lipase family protein [Gemmataceae bacterium]